MIWVLLALLGISLFAGGAVVAKSYGKPRSRFADAIAHAEGYYVPGSRPYRNNNPGDFVLAPPATKYTAKSDGTYAIFDTADDGWAALEDELNYIRTGTSHYYNVN